MKNRIFAITLLAASLTVGATFAHGQGECRHGGHPGHGAMFSKLDKNGDQKVDRSEAHAAARQRFADMDANKNQVVTLEEARTAMEKKWAQHHVSPEQRALHFKAKDKNKNGKLERDETHMSARHFDKIDQNHDGGLTIEELRVAREHHEQQRKDKAPAQPGGRLFAHFDQNHDGQITAEENDRGALSMFDTMDGNKDGFLTQQEVKLSFKKHHRQHGKRAQGHDQGKSAGSTK